MVSLVTFGVLKLSNLLIIKKKKLSNFLEFISVTFCVLVCQEYIQDVPLV
jgi:hypothetical protein